MNFTFGIITGGGHEERINTIIDSIEAEAIPVYEVVIVGSANVERKNTRVIPFDESQKPMWITKKKNLVTACAQYENIVYMHDYLALEPGWYQGWLDFGSSYAVAMNRILNSDNTRFRDWTLDPFMANLPDAALDQHVRTSRQLFLPYDVTHLSKFMYISGAYWVAKKNVMIAFPLDENRVWAQSEDLEWSGRVRQTFEFTMNQNSCVKIIKDWKDQAFREMDEDTINRVRALKV